MLAPECWHAYSGSGVVHSGSGRAIRPSRARDGVSGLVAASGCCSGMLGHCSGRLGDRRRVRRWDGMRRRRRGTSPCGETRRHHPRARLGGAGRQGGRIGHVMSLNTGRAAEACGRARCSSRSLLIVVLRAVRVGRSSPVLCLACHGCNIQKLRRPMAEGAAPS